jgi:hypothetical protein
VDYRSEQYLITENATLECEYVQELFPVSSDRNERGLKLRIDGGKLEYSYDEALELGAVATAKPPSVPSGTSMQQAASKGFVPSPIPAPSAPDKPWWETVGGGTEINVTPTSTNGPPREVPPNPGRQGGPSLPSGTVI